MAICGECHREFEGTRFRCPICAAKKRESRNYLRLKRDNNGVCTMCGKPRDDTNFKLCRRCRTKMQIANSKKYYKKTRFTKNQIETITIQDVAKTLKPILHKYKLKNSFEIIDDLKTGLELLGLKYSNKMWK